jgi:hypothetical protein
VTVRRRPDDVGLSQKIHQASKHRISHDYQRAKYTCDALTAPTAAVERD